MPGGGGMTAEQMALYRQQMAQAQASAMQANAMPGGGSGEMQRLQAEYTQIAMRAAAGHKEAARQTMAAFLPEAAEAIPADKDIAEWGEAAQQLQRQWLAFHQQQPQALGMAGMPLPLFADPAQWMGLMQGWFQHVPLLDPRRQAEIVAEGLALWEDVLAQYGMGPKGAGQARSELHFPRHDKRFADAAWREQPVFALIHQTYLLLAERVQEAIDQVEGL
jgi:polyhydroxyalkanoate synthase